MRLCCTKFVEEIFHKEYTAKFVTMGVRIISGMLSNRDVKNTILDNPLVLRIHQNHTDITKQTILSTKSWGFFILVTTLSVGLNMK